MHNPIKSVAAVIKRVLRVDDKTASALMPNGDQNPHHYVGGYDIRSETSEAQDEYERDTAGWQVVE